MEHLEIPLDDETLVFLNRQAAESGCESAGVYVAALIAADYKQWARENLERLLLEGIESGPATPMTRRDWDDLRLRVRQRIASETTAEREADAPVGAGR